MTDEQGIEMNRKGTAAETTKTLKNYEEEELKKMAGKPEKIR
jgi:hypothetical protein